MAHPPINVFLSAGGPATEVQRDFIAELKSVLQSENFLLKSAPVAARIEDTIKYIEGTMNECSGAVILAFERVHIERGQEFRGGHLPKRVPKSLVDVKLTTVWNQIEAAIAELRGLPLLIMFEDGLRIDGFLEHNTWRPIGLSLDTAQLKSGARHFPCAEPVRHTVRWRQTVMGPIGAGQALPLPIDAVQDRWRPAGNCYQRRVGGVRHSRTCARSGTGITRSGYDAESLWISHSRAPNPFRRVRRRANHSTRS